MEVYAGRRQGYDRAKLGGDEPNLATVRVIVTRDLVAEIFRANVCVMRVRSTVVRESSQSSLVLSLLSAVLLLDGGESVRRESGPRRRPRAKRHKKD